VQILCVATLSPSPCRNLPEISRGALLVKPAGPYAIQKYPAEAGQVFLAESRWVRTLTSVSIDATPMDALYPAPMAIRLLHRRPDLAISFYWYAGFRERVPESGGVRAAAAGIASEKAGDREARLQSQQLYRCIPRL